MSGRRSINTPDLPLQRLQGAEKFFHCQTKGIGLPGSGVIIWMGIRSVVLEHFTDIIGLRGLSSVASLRAHDLSHQGDRSLLTWMVNVGRANERCAVTEAEFV